MQIEKVSESVVCVYIGDYVYLIDGTTNQVETWHICEED